MYQKDDEKEARASGQKRKAGLPSSGDVSQVRSRVESGFAEACFQGSACTGITGSRWLRRVFILEMPRAKSGGSCVKRPHTHSYCQMLQA